MTYTERTTCRSCGHALVKENVWDFGNQTIVDFLAEGEEGRGKAPLQMVACRKCSLLQLRHTVDCDTLFRKFWYRSGVNEQMREALLDVIITVEKYVSLNNDDVVGDIGSNDGQLLSSYSPTLCRVGFEPAKGLAAEAQEKVPSAIMVSEYFGKDFALRASGGRKYKAITAVAMFYDVDDPGKFVRDIASVLEDDGVFIIQMNYLHSMLKNLTFDNVGHEHLGYYSFTALQSVLEQNGMKVVHAELNEVNGGSIRVAARKGTIWPRDKSVREILEIERSVVLEDSYKGFGDRVREVSTQLKTFLQSLKAAGKTVYAYGASTRGSTLLQTMLGDTPATEFFAGVAERDPNKFGLSMAGLNLPIVSEQIAREAADYMFLLPYHFWPSIQKRERTWMLTGGRFIVPLPFPRVLKLAPVPGCSEFSIVKRNLIEELSEVHDMKNSAWV